MISTAQVQFALLTLQKPTGVARKIEGDGFADFGEDELAFVEKVSQDECGADFEAQANDGT
jgi:hypothetical protein